MSSYWTQVQEVIDADMMYDAEGAEIDFNSDYEPSECALCNVKELHDHDPEEYGSFDEDSDWYEQRHLR